MIIEIKPKLFTKEWWHWFNVRLLQEVWAELERERKRIGIK